MDIEGLKAREFRIDTGDQYSTPYLQGILQNSDVLANADPIA